MTVEDAYAVQRAWVHLEESRGQVIRGYKVGLTTPAMQKALRSDGPAYGPLFDEMLLSAGEPTGAERFIAPRVEVELAFVLGRSLQGSTIEIQDVLEATAYVSPAFEIIDTRIEQLDRETRQPRSLIDMVSDFGAAAGVVLGAASIQGGRARPVAVHCHPLHKWRSQGKRDRRGGSGSPCKQCHLARETARPPGLKP